MKTKEWQGMNWITQKKRLAIYLRDGLACSWCGFTLEGGAVLSLDHLKPRSKGGDNHECNLVTACKHCNDSRGKRSLASFADGVAEYLADETDAKFIRNRVRNNARRVLRPFIANAQNLIEIRGSAANVINRGKS